jgi:hypothetical protein
MTGRSSLRGGELAAVVIISVLGALLISVMAGCAPATSARHGEGSDRVSQRGSGSAPGYPPAQQHAFSALDEVWRLDANPVQGEVVVK